MKNFLLLLTVLFSHISIYSQNYTYDDFRVETKMFLDIALSSEEDAYLILATQDDYAMSTFITKPKNDEKTLSDAFKMANCNNCKLYKKENIDKKPIDYIFSNIEERRVYKLIKQENGFLLIQYRGED